MYLFLVGYNAHPLFKNYPFEKFEDYLMVITNAAQTLQEVVANDEQEIQSELIAYPRGEATVHGYPFWDTHDASALLEADINDGSAAGMQPNEL